MAPHPSTLAWKIPWMEKSSGLQSMGSLRVRHDWATFLSLFTFMYWRRKWQPTPVFLPRESQGRGSLVGCHLWSRTESDMTEQLSSSSRILASFSIWGKPERWKSSISKCLISLPLIKKNNCFEVSSLILRNNMNHFSPGLWHVTKSGFYTNGDDQLSG